MRIDPCVVDHLVEDHQAVLGLHDAHGVVVERRQHRRALAEAQDAALVEGPVLDVVVGAGAVAFVQPPGGAVVAHESGHVLAKRLGGLGGHRRATPVGRIGQDGAPVLAVDLEAAVTRVDPEPVVAADVAGAQRLAFGAATLEAHRGGSALGRRLA